MQELHRHWFGLLVRGIIAITFGVIALTFPTLALQFLVLLFGAFAFIDGLIAVFVGAASRSAEFILEGVVGLAVGLAIFFFTDLSVLVLILLIGLWAIITGVFEIAAGLRLRKHIANEIWLLFIGIVSIAFGVLVFLNPLISAIAVSWLIGVYALVFGIFLVALSLTVRGHKVKKAKRR